MKKCNYCLFCLLAILVTSCSQNHNYTLTEQATASGGAIGAGLGAIVGSATGDAGTGLVIGALAGSGTGALIGNAIEENNNNKQVAMHDSRISENTRQIDSQKYEIQELRNRNIDGSGRSHHSDHTNNDGISLKHLYENSYNSNTGTRMNYGHDSYSNNTHGNTHNNMHTNNNHHTTSNANPNSVRGWLSKNNIWKSNNAQHTATNTHTYTRNTHQPTVTYEAPTAPTTSYTYTESTIVEPSNTFTESKIVIPEATETIVYESETPTHTGNSGSYTFNSNSSDCQQAKTEIANANASSDVADKLYHQRRALRLCPKNPTYHNGLGEIYLSLNRDEDAAFEFEEALKIDPSFESASRNLAILR